MIPLWKQQFVAGKPPMITPPTPGLLAPRMQGPYMGGNPNLRVLGLAGDPEQEPGMMGKVESWMKGPGGDALAQAGYSMLMDSGPHPQGTGPSLGQALAKAGMVFGQAYKEGRLEDAQRKALTDPDLLEALTPAQRVLLQALPPAKAVEVLTAATLQNDTANLQQVRDEGNGVVHLINPHTGATVRDIPIAEGGSQGSLTFQNAPNGDILGMSRKTGEQVVRIPHDWEHDPNGLLKMQQDFMARPEAKNWAESQVQLTAAQENFQASSNQGDLALIVAAAKILDPNSVVREGEVTMQNLTASPVDQLKATANRWLSQGTLSQQMREGLLGVIERTARQRFNAFERLKAQAGPIYTQAGIDPQLIFGPWKQPTYLLLGPQSSDYPAPQPPSGTPPAATGHTNSPVDILNKIRGNG